MEMFLSLTLMISIAVGTICYSMGSVNTNNNWIEHCNKVGVHVVREKVYECKERK